MDGIIAAAGLAGPAAEQGRGAEGAPPPARRPVLHRLENTAIGRRGPDGEVMVRRREPTNCFLSGPFWQLRAGQYRLSFRCRSGQPRFAAQPVLALEILALGRDQRAIADFTAAELDGGEGEVLFDVPAALSLESGEEARFEFRFLHLGNADLTVGAVDLERLDDYESIGYRGREWRLLGRLWHTAIGRRDENGSVTARRWMPPGLLLYGCRPYLRLAQGHYRLSLRCGAGPPRVARHPAIAVEITARPWSAHSRGNRQARDRVTLAAADFAVAELGGGVAALDFTVPLELAIESGDDVPIEFRAYHLGNAALRIDAVELRGLVETARIAPARWRILDRLRFRRWGPQIDRVIEFSPEESAGSLLRSGGPRLELDPGRYRLTLAAASGPPAERSQPVLRAEILARPHLAPWWPGRLPKLLRKHEFTAGELAGRATKLDFVVPATIAEAGNPACEVRLRYLGNADLRLTAAEVWRTSSPVARPAICAPAVARGKPRHLLIIGNCQAETVRQVFDRAAPLRRRFKPTYHFVGLHKTLHALGRRELAEADLLLVQDIRDWESYPLREAVPERVEIIKFPLLRFASLWPFDHYNGPGDKEAMEREWPNLTFICLDGLLGRLRREIPDQESRFRAYRSLRLPGIVNIARLHDFESRRLRLMDRQFGCAIGEYILREFGKRRLFHTTMHPGAPVFAMLIEWLMRRVGSDAPLPPLDALDNLNRWQVPVHPRVAEALGVTWAGEAAEYVYEDRRVTWEEYTRGYIEHYG